MHAWGYTSTDPIRLHSVVLNDSCTVPPNNIFKSNVRVFLPMKMSWGTLMNRRILCLENHRWYVIIRSDVSDYALIKKLLDPNFGRKMGIKVTISVVSLNTGLFFRKVV
jgi:hypothetical protein